MEKTDTLHSLDNSGSSSKQPSTGRNRKANIVFPRVTENSAESGHWGNFLQGGTTSRGLLPLFGLNPFHIISILLLPTIIVPIMPAIMWAAVFIVVLRRRPMVAVPSPRRRRRPPIPSVRVVIIWRRPIVYKPGVIVNRRVHSPEVEPDMHTRASLGCVDLAGHCHQGKYHEAANNEHFTFHFRSPL